MFSCSNEEEENYDEILSVVNMMTKAAKIWWHRRAYCEGCAYYNDNDNDYEESGHSYDQVT